MKPEPHHAHLAEMRADRADPIATIAAVPCRALWIMESDASLVARVEPHEAEEALAAARAVTVDVCRYLDCSESNLLAVVTSLYESRARAISDATAARGTVGGLLATAPVGSIVESGSDSVQYRSAEIDPGHRDTGNVIEVRTFAFGVWSTWTRGAYDISYSLHLPARLVPAAEADADPSQRGPLPKGG